MTENQITKKSIRLRFLLILQGILIPILIIIQSIFISDGKYDILDLIFYCGLSIIFSIMYIVCIIEFMKLKKQLKTNINPKLQPEIPDYKCYTCKNLDGEDVYEPTDDGLGEEKTGVAHECRILMYEDGKCPYGYVNVFTPRAKKGDRVLFKHDENPYKDQSGTYLWFDEGDMFHHINVDGKGERYFHDDEFEVIDEGVDP